MRAASMLEATTQNASAAMTKNLKATTTTKYNYKRWQQVEWHKASTDLQLWEWTLEKMNTFTFAAATCKRKCESGECNFIARSMWERDSGNKEEISRSTSTQPWRKWLLQPTLSHTHTEKKLHLSNVPSVRECSKGRERAIEHYTLHILEVGECLALNHEQPMPIWRWSIVIIIDNNFHRLHPVYFWQNSNSHRATAVLKTRG